MPRFVVGEEVRHQGGIYVVSSVQQGEPTRYRLLASRPGGTRFLWVAEQELEEIESYLSSRDDTASL